MHDRFQRRDHLVRRHIHFSVLRTDEIGDLPGVFQVDGVLAHADGKGADRFFALPCGDGADKGGIKAAGEQKAHLCVRRQPLFHPGDQFFADLLAGGLKVVAADAVHLCDIAVADEPAAFIVVSRGERKDLFAKSDEIFRLTGKQDDAACVVSVVQRTDADGIARGDEFVRFAVVDHTGEFGVQPGKQIRAVFKIHGEQDLAVAVACKSITLFDQPLPLGFETVQFPVTNGIAAVFFKRLHAGGGKPHDGQAVKGENTAARFDDAAVVRSTGPCLRKAVLKRGLIPDFTAITEN